MSRFKKLLVEIHRRLLWQLLGSYIVGAWLADPRYETLIAPVAFPNGP